jgi:methionine biosynthesis protein MetW
VILSQTLPFLNDPAMILREMLRVGRQAIVSFSNWGHWRCRLDLLFSGRIPVAVDLPQQWYEVPRRQLFTVTDFALFCRQIDIEIAREIYLNRGLRINTGRFKNLLSTTAVYNLRPVAAPGSADRTALS